MIHFSNTQQTVFLGLCLIASSLISAPLLHAQTGGCTKTVSKGGGADFTSIQSGINGISSGQTLCVKGGNWKYEEAITLNKANITVKAHPDTPAPVLDGKYNRSLIIPTTEGIKLPLGTAPGYLPGYTQGKDKKGKTTLNPKSMVAITAPSATFDGFVIQNIAGRGIGISASDVTVSNNKLYWIHNSAIASNNTSGGVKNIVVKNNIAMFGSLFSIDPDFKDIIDKENQPDPAGGIVKFGNLSGGLLLQGNYFAYNHGEGINIGKNNRGSAQNPLIIEKNVIHDSHHKIINTNSSQYVHIRNNLVFSPNPMIKVGERIAGGPIDILDESTEKDKQTPYIWSRDIYFYNNIVVNTQQNCIRMAGRNSVYRNMYIGFNTFVTGPNTTHSCIQNREPTANFNGIFENNIIHSTHAPAFKGLAGNLTFRNNLWYPTDKAPTDAMFGSGSLKVDPKLVDPNSQIKALKYPGEAKGTFLNYSDLEFLPNGFQVDIDVNKYRINSGSPAINAASQRTAVNGFMPPQEAYATDFFGRARGTNPDIGAHESDGTAAPTPTAGPSPTQEPTPDDWDLDNDDDVDVFDFNRFIKKVMSNQDSWTKLASFIAAFRLGE